MRECSTCNGVGALLGELGMRVCECVPGVQTCPGDVEAIFEVLRDARALSLTVAQAAQRRLAQLEHQAASVAESIKSGGLYSRSERLTASVTQRIAREHDRTKRLIATYASWRSA